MLRSFVRMYQTFPTVESVQWGMNTATTSGATVTLPIAFTTTTYRVVVTSTWGTNSIGTIVDCVFNSGQKTKNNFKVKTNVQNGFDYIAIGH